jgi:MFS family permease
MADVPAIHSRPRWPQALLLLLGSCLPILGGVLVAPVLPLIQAHFAATPGSIVLVPIVLTIPALMIALLAPFAGLLVDRFGRKWPLLLCLALYTACGVLPLWLENLTAIVISRVGLGLAEAGIMTVCTTLIGDYYDGAKRQRLLTLQAIVTSLSAMVFITLGGLMGQDGWRAPFVLYWAGWAFIPLVLWLIWEPGKQVDDSSVDDATGGLSFPWRRLLPLYALVLAAGCSVMIVPVQLSYLLAGIGISGPDQVGLTMGLNQLGIVIGASLFRILGRLPFEYLLLLAFSAAGLGLFMLPSEHYPMIAAAVLINGLGIGLMIPVLGSWVLSQVGFALRGRASGGFMAAFFGGEFLSPMVILALMGGLSLSLANGLMLVGLVHIVLGLMCLVLPARSEKPARTQLS